MPNHVLNQIAFQGEPERVKELLESVKNDELGLGSLDFQKVIPMPNSVFQGDLGNDEREKYGANNWYDWSVMNWGAKWNSYGYDDLSQFQSDDTVVFNTAWSAPHPVMLKLSEQYPDITISHRWADEDIGYNCGKRDYTAGEITAENIPVGGSKEAYELAGDIHDLDLAEFGFHFDEETQTYEYSDDEPQLTQ